MQELNPGETFGLAIKIFALLTPTAVLSAFISYTRSSTRAQKFAIAVKTGVAIYIIGQLLYLFGARIFAVFGFTLDAFRIGAGLLLFLEAIALMRGDDHAPPPKRDADISVVPLAIPLGMGPATIGTVMVMGASATSTEETLAGSACIFAAALGVSALLCLAGPTQRLLRKTGILVMAKLTALLLSAVAAQVIFTGIRAFIHTANLH